MNYIFFKGKQKLFLQFNLFIFFASMLLNGGKKMDKETIEIPVSEYQHLKTVDAEYKRIMSLIHEVDL